MKRKLFLLFFVPFLIPNGALIGQSSANIVTQRYVTLSGSSIDSTHYSVVTVIGQPVANVVNSSSFKVSGGFLHARYQETKTDHNLWLPIILK